MRLRGSVGLGGRNWKPDVIRIQRLLDQAGVSPGPPMVAAAADNAGDRTVSAALHAQARRAGRRERPDLSKAAIPCSPCGRATIAKPNHRQRHPSEIHRIPRRLQAPFANTSKNGSHPAASANIDYRRTERLGLLGNAYTTAVPGAVNRGLTCPTSQQMEALFGDPHEKRVKDRLITGSVGPMRVTGHRAALESLSTMFAKVKRDLPDLYGLIASWGMYNLRNIRGRNCYSNHSWGTAIDLIVDGLAIHLGETQSCKELTLWYRISTKPAGIGVVAIASERLHAL